MRKERSSMSGECEKEVRVGGMQKEDVMKECMRYKNENCLEEWCGCVVSLSNMKRIEIAKYWRMDKNGV